MEPEKDGFQKESPFPGVHFQVNHVSFRGSNLSQNGRILNKEVKTVSQIDVESNLELDLQQYMQYCSNSGTWKNA